jgi:hypothetical protein
MTDTPTLDSVVEREIGKHYYTYDPDTKLIRIEDQGANIDIIQNNWNDPYMSCECADVKQVGTDEEDYTCPHLKNVKRYFIPEILKEVWNKVAGDDAEFLASYEAHIWPRATFRFHAEKLKARGL